MDTYGCQQNEADSEKLRGYLREMGCGFTEDEFQADIIVVNTCAVREHAEMRVLGNVGALNHSKKARPGQIIAVCGCMVQQPHMAEKLKKSYPIVDLVFGPHELWRFPELLQTVMDRHKRIFAAEKNDGAVAEGDGARRQGEGLAVGHVRLQQLLHLLRGALCARARTLAPAGRGDPGGGGAGAGRV